MCFDQNTFSLKQSLKIIQPQYAERHKPDTMGNLIAPSGQERVRHEYRKGYSLILPDNFRKVLVIFVEPVDVIVGQVIQRSAVVVIISHLMNQWGIIIPHLMNQWGEHLH